VRVVAFANSLVPGISSQQQQISKLKQDLRKRKISIITAFLAWLLENQLTNGLYI